LWAAKPDISPMSQWKTCSTWPHDCKVNGSSHVCAEFFHQRSLYDQFLPLVLINLPMLTIQFLNTLMTAAAMRCCLWNHSRQPLLGSPSSTTGLLHHCIVPGFVRHPVVCGFSSLEDGSLKSSESYLIGPNEQQCNNYATRSA
jgi:hypothetical protein